MKFFAVVSFPRTGTHLLQSAFNSHSQVETHYEPFNEYLIKTNITAARYLRKIRSDKPVQYIALHWHHARSRYTDIWDIIVDEQWSVIGLHRDNLLEQYASLQIAKQTGTWGIRNPENLVHSNITIDIEDFHYWFASMRQQVVDLNAWLEPLNHLTVEYNEICGNLEKIQSFLGLSVENIQPKTIKQGSAMSETIINYTQVQDYLKRFEYEI